MYWRLTLVVVLTLLTACTAQQSHSENSSASNQATSEPTVAVAPAAAEPSYAAGSIDGQVFGAGKPIAKATVTLYSATSDAPKQGAQTQTGDDGKFTMSFGAGSGILYLVAAGGEPAAAKVAGNNPAIVLISVLGAQPPAHAVVNELTTVASVWTMNQFVSGTAVEGYPLGLHIAAGNVPNFVDLQTGGWGGAIQDSLNGGQTPTMANFATLADALSGCIARVTTDACATLFSASAPPDGSAPSDTLAAAEAIARYPWYKPQRVFALLDRFYPIPQGKNLRPVPFMPYLSWEPSAWVLPLRFDGGGYRAGGKAMFDSQGNLWVPDNFSIGWQGQDTLWEGHATKFAPNGQPLSPITTGFTGGGMEGGTFGAAVDAHDNAWFTNYGSQSITVFSKDGTPLTPPEGITFGGRLGLMQGIIVTPSGDVWILGISKNQLVYFPKGDLTRKGRIVCEGAKEEPCKSFRAPFHLGIDRQNRIWVSNSGVDHVTRFPATDPSKVENFKTGINNSGLAIDSRGDVWVTNRFGTGLLGMAHLVDMGIRLKFKGVARLRPTTSRRRCRSSRAAATAAALRSCDPTARSFPALHSKAAVFRDHGLPRLTATTTYGFPTSRCRAVRSWNSAACARRTVRRG